jgi:hypothetical protein
MGNVQGHEEEMDSDDDVSQNSSGESDYEMAKTSLNGELYVLFEKHTPQQFRENLNKMIELLSRKIHLMQTHSNVLFDMYVLCVNVQKMERHGGFDNVHCGSIKNTDIIEGDKTIVQSIKELITVLIYFEQNGVPDFTSTRRFTFGEYVAQLHEHYDWEYWNLYSHHIMTAQEQLRDSRDETISQIEELKQFRKHKGEFKNIGHQIFMNDHNYGMHITNVQLIKRYITNIKRIIRHLKQPDPMDTWTNIEMNTLEPGCEMFYIRRGAMTDMEILTQLKMKAEKLLRNETMVIEWEKHQQEKKILMDATRLASTPTLANKAKANKAKALLTSDSFTTMEEREKVLASGGIMTSLVDALVQPPSQMQPKELAQLKRMISNRRSGGTQRRKTKSKSMKIKHLTQPK